MSLSKFKKGDKVKVIKYGHLTWYSDMGAVNNFHNFGKKMHKEIADILLWGKSIDSEMPEDDYSHLIYSKCEHGGFYVDSSPGLVGKEGVIEGSYFDLYGKETYDDETKARNSKEYSISGIDGKNAWYDEDQLELI